MNYTDEVDLGDYPRTIRGRIMIPTLSAKDKNNGQYTVYREL